ncbi:MAG TPA: CYTH and CHAD domain-containing protein [Dehalococcoidia bacterium]|nr:CYTH and CHAD domain-containing protein [Dehalococcoidia bacterium]
MPAQDKEREIKLIVPEDFDMPDLNGGATGVASVVEAEPLDLTASYFDTSDLRLMSSGITVRRRTGEAPEPVWTLKLPVDGDPTLRTEVTQASDGHEPPPEIASLLKAVLIDADLVPVAELKTRRRVWRLLDAEGGELAELVDDRVSILDGNEIKDSFREIEVEARNAEAAGLKRIARVIEKSGGKPEQRSKASRALDVIRNRTAPTAAPAVSPGDPAAAAVRDTLSRLLRAMVARAPHALLAEVEGVHRMRVGQRRLRSVLRAFGPLLDKDKVTPFVDELRWLGTVLGEVRDLDVFEINLRDSAGDDPTLTPLFSTVAARKEAARARLAEALASDRYLDLIRTGQKLLDDEALVVAQGPCTETLPPLTTSAADKLRKTAGALTPASPEADYHEVRKLAKRARYTAEAVSEYEKRKESRALLEFAGRMTAVQNVFGAHQDATLARDTIIAIASEHPTNGALNLQTGRLIERADKQASALRELALRKWNKLEKDKSTKWPRR